MNTEGLNDKNTYILYYLQMESPEKKPAAGVSGKQQAKKKEKSPKVSWKYKLITQITNIM